MNETEKGVVKLALGIMKREVDEAVEALGVQLPVETHAREAIQFCRFLLRQGYVRRQLGNRHWVLSLQAYTNSEDWLGEYQEMFEDLADLNSIEGRSREHMRSIAVMRRDEGKMSWKSIAEELDVSPATARRLYDEVKGDGAHSQSIVYQDKK